MNVIPPSHMFQNKPRQFLLGKLLQLILRISDFLIIYSDPDIAAHLLAQGFIFQDHLIPKKSHEQKKIFCGLVKIWWSYCRKSLTCLEGLRRSLFAMNACRVGSLWFGLMRFDSGHSGGPEADSFFAVLACLKIVLNGFDQQVSSFFHFSLYKQCHLTVHKPSNIKIFSEKKYGNAGNRSRGCRVRSSIFLIYEAGVWTNIFYRQPSH